MHQELKRRSPGRGWLRAFSRAVLAAVCALGLPLLATPARAQIDTAIDATVWKILYGVSDAQINDPVWLAADDDGDGVSNGAELVAGTNPFDRTSALVVTSVTQSSGGGVSLTFPTVTGKLYVVQSNTDLTNTSGWTAVSPALQVEGDSTVKTLTTAAITTGPVYYRIAVQDVDTDGDGVSDWAEGVTGFDPTTAHTHGAAEDDHTALTNDLVSENVVTISAPKPTATQPPDAVTAATDTGTITITRGGTLHFSTLTVPLVWSGTAVSGVDYAAMPASVTFLPHVGVITLTVVPMANPARLVAGTVTASAVSGGGYNVGTANAASVAIAPAGNTAGTGLTGEYFKETSAVNTQSEATVFAAANLKLTRLDSTVDFTWASGTAPDPSLPATYYAVRWSGQVQPQYSETYYFDTLTDDGVILYVNGQKLLNYWVNGSVERAAGIALQAGVLYDITMEYYQYTGAAQSHLYWYSNSQSKQVIPTVRLYPKTQTASPPALTSAATAVGFVGQPFTYTTTASTTGGLGATFALGARSAALPPGLALNAATGVISGTPTLAGDYQVALSATNALGTGAGVLDIQIINAGSGVTRELWTSGVTGATLAGVPFSSAPTSINSIAAPDDNTAYAARTGMRLRGYFTAPTTGNYYFWLAANNVAELWVSDDAEYVNRTRRAWVIAPGTAAHAWTASGQSSQRSPWLALVAGQKYYYEVLYNSGDSGTSNVSVGCLQDPTGAATTPVVGNGTGVTPNYVVSQYDYPATAAATGALYVTNLSPQGVSVSSATGSANLRMNPGNTQGILHFNFSGLTSPRTAYHIHMGADPTSSGPIVFDIDDVDRFHPELKTADGGYIWNIADVGSITAAQIVTAIQEGFCYFNVHTVNFPAGEIRGNLGLVQGSQTPPTLAADPGFTDDSATDAGAARFLNQAAYGASPGDLASVESGGYTAWINNQVALPATHLYPDVIAHTALDPRFPYPSTLYDNAWWRAAVQGPDQLRQRVTFALSEILVVSSANSTLSNRADSLASFYDTLADNAFGNFHDMLKAVTLHPCMGYYLNVQGNPKGNLATGLHPNENYGREVMQLFSIGLNRLWPDGTLVLDSSGSPVPTYDQDMITGMARVFTGWTWAQSTPANGSQLTNFYPAVNWVSPMTLVPSYHELGTKDLLDNVVLPAAAGYNFPAANTTGSQADPTTALCNAYCNADLDAAINAIFNHPNTGPYICRQLIQRLVTGNPSPEYVYRVVQTFNDDGTAQHVRGNMTAVVKAILLDGEARNIAAGSVTTSGKQREPLLRIAAPARTFPYAANTGTYSQTAGSFYLTVTLAAGSTNRLNSGDGVSLDFTINDTGNPPVAPWYNPATGAYKVLGTPAPTTTAFSVTPLGVTNATYTVAAQATTPVTYLTTVNTTGPSVATVNGASVYGEVYLQFLPAGSGPDGIYRVTAPSGTNLQVYTSTSPSTATGSSVVVPKTTGLYVITNPTGATASTFEVITNVNHNLQAGDKIWLDLTAGSSSIVTPQECTVSSVINENSFYINNTTLYSKAETNSNVTIYELKAPLITRSGSVGQAASKFDMGSTNGLLVQTPLDSPSVFNFFYPDYKYPGPLAASNVTSPEFQLTTDTNVITLTNTLDSTILSSSNTSGLCSFNGGSILLDLSPYMTSPYEVADTAGVSALIDKMNSLLTGGQLTAATKNEIVNYVTGSTVVNGKSTPNFASTSATNVRDRVRAIVQLILISPEYAIQR